MYKKIAILIIICLCTVGCGQSAQLLPFINENAGKTDFGEESFYIVSDVDPAKSVQDSFLSYGATTSNYDAAIKRFSDVEAKYNCKLEFVTPINSRDMLLAAAVEKPIDIVIHPIYYGGFTDIMQGIYTPISQVAAIDYTDSEKWGSPNMLEIFCYNNEIYGVIPALWPDSNIMSSDFLLVINEDMITANSLTDPRDLFEQGKWTHDEFLNTVSGLYNNDDPNRVIYGFTGTDRHVVDIGLKSFNVDFVIENNGIYENGYMTDDFITAIEWINNFINGEYSEMSIFEGMDCVKRWANNETGIAMVHMNYLCSMGGSDSSSEIIHSDKEYGLAPFPSLDGKTIHAQYERVINGIMFPIWSVKTEEIGRIANDIFEPLEGFETIESQIDNLNTYLFFDPRDTQLVFDMVSQAKYLYHDEGINDYHRGIVESLGSKSAAQIQQENESRINLLIEEYIQPARSSMQNLFGE